MLDGFTAHRIRFVCEALDPVGFDPQKGSALRGAFFSALWGAFCANRAAPSCTACHLIFTCPVGFLVATMDEAAARPEAPAPAPQPPPLSPQPSALSRYLQALPTGGQLPRPYTIEPPLDRRERYRPGERVEFGLTLFARALPLFPYVVLAVQQWERMGLGRPLPENRGRRGRVALREAWAEHPLTGERRRVLQREERMVRVPDLPVTHAAVLRAAGRVPAPGRVSALAGDVSGLQEDRMTASGEALAVTTVPGEDETGAPALSNQADPRLWERVEGAACTHGATPALADEARPQPVRRLALRFLTPTRLVDGGRPVRTPHLRVVVQRLLERLTILAQTFGAPLVGAPLDGEDGGHGALPVFTREQVRHLLEVAESARLVEDRTAWVDVWSHSARTRRASPIGGFVGSAVYEAAGSADLRPLWPWLLWGQVVHVGKDTVKGNGWYVLSEVA